MSSDQWQAAAIAATIWLTLAGYWMAMALILASGPGSGAQGRAARRWWTLAVVSYLLHVAAAFHYRHDWSHERAYAMVQEQSGFGPGIFITYCFSVVWTADAIWWWLAPTHRARRPRWLSVAIHGLIAFILFNGAVVFEAGPVRWVSLLGFTALAGLAWRRAPRKSP